MKMTNFVDQSDFGFYPKANMLGAIADAMLSNTDSPIFEGGTLNFGDALMQGSEDHLAKPFDGSNLFFRGVFFRRFAKNGRTIGAGQPSPEAETEILTVFIGRVMVKAKNTIAIGDKAAINAAGEWVGGGGAVGDYLLEGATFLSSGDAGDYVKLELTGGRHFTEIVAPTA